MTSTRITGFQTKAVDFIKKSIVPRRRERRGDFPPDVPPNTKYTCFDDESNRPHNELLYVKKVEDYDYEEDIDHVKLSSGEPMSEPTEGSTPKWIVYKDPSSTPEKQFFYSTKDQQVVQNNNLVEEQQDLDAHPIVIGEDAHPIVIGEDVVQNEIIPELAISETSTIDSLKLVEIHLPDQTIFNIDMNNVLPLPWASGAASIGLATHVLLGSYMSPVCFMGAVLLFCSSKKKIFDELTIAKQDIALVYRNKNKIGIRILNFVANLHTEGSDLSNPSIEDFV